MTDRLSSQRWPRGRTRARARHRRERWNPERPSEDLPALSVTIALTAAGAGVLAVGWWMAPAATSVAAVTLLAWSIAVEVTGNTVTTRTSTPLRRLLWLVLRPAYLVGFVLWSIVEALLELVLG